MVADIKDAFFNIPTDPSERHHTVVRCWEYWIHWVSCVFGSGSSPLLWARYAAFFGRLFAAVFKETEARLQIYVDDPACAVRGDARHRRRTVTKWLLLWQAFGVPFSWSKTSRGWRTRKGWAECHCRFGNGFPSGLDRGGARVVHRCRPDVIRLWFPHLPLSCLPL